MDASQTFSHLLKLIETSNLNYKLSKTTFSATISLKSSFVRRFHEDFSRPSPDTHFRLAKEDLGKENLDLKKVEEENFELKAKIKEFEDSAEKLEQKTAQLQIAFENSKVKSEDLKRQISDFREEVLKIKGEKRDMRKDFDAEKTKSFNR